jgi:hypothetical protein
LVEQEQQQARARDATRAAANAAAEPAEPAEAAAEPVLGPWPFAGVEAPGSPWVAPGLAAGADATTRRRGVRG